MRFVSTFLFTFSSLFTSNKAACPTGQWEFNQNCYFFSYNRLSWQHAEEFCVSQRGHLVSVETAFENSQLLVMFGDIDFSYDDVWSGGNNLDDGTTWLWSDGKPFTYSHWKPGFPSSDSSQCLILDQNDGRYSNVNCRMQRQYVCKFPQNNLVNSTTPRPTSSASSCPNGYRLWQGFCYKAIIQPYFTFPQADYVCKSEGGDLVSIHSDAENNYVLAVLRKFVRENDPYIWIGLVDPGNTGRFHWTDGTNLDYTNWIPGEPSETHSAGYATEFYPSTGKWYARRTDTGVGNSGFVCKQQPSR